MVKKRRKLNTDMENQIASAKRKVELVTAIIGDIQEEDIQGDYIFAFEPIKVCIANLEELYKNYGFNEESEKILSLFEKLITKFEDEYEI